MISNVLPTAQGQREEKEEKEGGGKGRKRRTENKKKKEKKKKKNHYNARTQATQSQVTVQFAVHVSSYGCKT